MAKIRLDLSQFKASGVYTIEFDASQSVVLNTQTTRLVVGFSKYGPINAPVYCPDVKTARRIFGDIDKDLENKGSFFHRSLFTCLETGPCFALALVKLNDDVSTPTADYDLYKSFSLSATEANGTTASVLYSSYFNKERFYYPDTSYFLANVAENQTNAGKLLNFTNLGQTPYSIFITKTGDLSGFNVTARDWFGLGNVPEFVKDFDYISDYFINVDIVGGDWTNYSALSVDPVFSKYFSSQGVIKSQYAAFLNSPYVTRIGSFQGSVIPDLVDTNGVNYSVDTIINASIATTGLFCALDRDALADYDNTDTTSAGRIDMIGHSLITQDTGSVNFLSYNFSSTELKQYDNTSTFTAYPNTIQINLGAGATGNLPGAAGYTASDNGYFYNSPVAYTHNVVAYFESFYGTGNQGKFNNVLVLRKEMLSSTQYDLISSLTYGSSIFLTGPGVPVMLSSYNEVLGEDGLTRIKLGISHPYKALEGQTSGKNAQVLLVDTTNSTFGSPAILVAGENALNQINTGDWIFAQSGSTTYYFRTDGVETDGTGNTIIYIDVENLDFKGVANLAAVNVNSTYYTVYWESTAETSGSLLDVIPLRTVSSLTQSLNLVIQPDIFDYEYNVSYTYTGYEYSGVYQDFEKGILADGDKVYVSTNGAQPLYLSASFGFDNSNIPVVNVTAFRNSELTIPFQGDWGFNRMRLSSGASASGKFTAYSGIGDYVSSIGAAGYNSTYTSFYVTVEDAPKIQVGQYLESDPMNTGVDTDWILTKVISKVKMVSAPWAGYYKISTNQRIANIAGYTKVNRYKSIQDVALNYQPTYLPGFKMTNNHIPNGGDARLGEILSMLDPSVSNLYDALSSRHIIAFRYIIDTFGGGLGVMSAPKNLITKLAKNRQKCLAIMNAPSIKQFVASKDPIFTDAPTSVNPKPLLNTAYIAQGGNLSLGPSFTYSLPDEDNGSKFSGFFTPFLTLRENNKNVNIPPAADVSNNFVRKFINGQPYSIVAGPRRGILSNPKLVGLEYDFTDTDRSNLEPFGLNPIVFRRGIGFMIHGNQSAYQTIPSAFNNLHVRDLLITIEEAVEDVLSGFLFEFNDASTRLQIKSIVDAYLDNVRSAGGLYNFETIMDTSNNTTDIIDQNFAIIDIGVEPVRGAQKFINRITVLKTGTINSGGFTVA